MNYQSELNRHLAEYKRAVLGISEAGLYRHHGADLPYDHILPIQQRDSNLLAEAAPFAQIFLRNSPGKRHRYFHHLNSSQAFAFNLFFPFFSGGDETAKVLLMALGQQARLTAWQLEDIPDEREGTNIDAWWKTNDGVQTFCEVKLSETMNTSRSCVRSIQKDCGIIWSPLIWSRSISFAIISSTAISGT